MSLKKLAKDSAYLIQKVSLIKESDNIIKFPLPILVKKDSSFEVFFGTDYSYSTFGMRIKKCIEVINLMYKETLQNFSDDFKKKTFIIKTIKSFLEELTTEDVCLMNAMGSLPNDVCICLNVPFNINLDLKNNKIQISYEKSIEFFMLRGKLINS